MGAGADGLRAGVVGLGMIGGGVAVSLARSGRAPQVYDVRADAADELLGIPRPLASPAAVAEVSDVVMVAVVTGAQAREVVLGEKGLLGAARPGATVVLLSTVELPVVHELAAACEERGVGFLDCGVTPGDQAAEHGMVAIVGGVEATVRAARPVLDDWAKTVVHCGPVGAGMVTKIARNVVTYGGWRAVSEAAALAAAAGVEPRELVEVIESADPDGRTLLQLLKFRGEDGLLSEQLAGQVEPLMAKDLDAALDLAGSLDVPVPLVQIARRHVRGTIGLVDEAGPEAPSTGPDASRAAEPAAEDEAASERHRKGLEMMDRVYGAGFSEQMPARPTGDPYLDETVQHLFADVWARPGLSVRDRRLLVLGATAALGRSDLIRVQVEGALAGEELDIVQLREAVLQLALYVGWGNATAVHTGVSEALAARVR
ncbi:NAD(P)-binding domain-containing protein [Streptomyces sulphureus]|uniref:NAD(P)-binding domain-containing protein n=1 Tax=Streptomyces sulphureus TaxID=47758 RepID=UPI000372086E|nr:NAD(P)-binding domain-containing protein [Streptomyces sulphureus]